MNNLRTTTVILLSSSILGFAPVKSGSLIGNHVEPKSDIEIFARSQMSNPEMINLAYRATVHEGVAAAYSGSMYSDAERNQKLMEADQQSLATVAGRNYRNGYDEALLKDSVTMAAAAGEVPLPVNTINKAIGDGLDSIATPPMHNLMTPEKSVEVFASVLAASRDSSHPVQQQAALQLLKDHFPSLDPTSPLEYRGEVVSERRYDSTLNAIAQLQQRIVKGQRISAQEIAALKKEFLETAEQTLSEAQNERKMRMGAQKNEEERRRHEQKFKDLSGIMGNLSQGAALIDDPVAARAFQESARVISLLGEADKLTGPFAENPAAYMNVYSALAVTALSLMKNSANDNAMAGIYQQLQKISVQIEELRKQILERFDALDHKLNHYFEISLVNMRNIDQGVRDSQKLALEVLNRQQKISRDLHAGINFLWTQKLASDLDCLQTGPKGVRINLSERDAAKCRNSFAMLTTADWDFSISAPDSQSLYHARIRSVPQEEYLQLADAAEKVGAFANGRRFSGHPGAWILGSEALLKFFALHPEWKSLAGLQSSSVPALNGAGDANLNSIISRGQVLAAELSDLALERDGHNFRLRNRLFSDLLQQYRLQSESALKTAEMVLRQASGNGAVVNRPLNLQDPPSTTDYAAGLNSPLKFCEAYEQNNSVPVKIGGFRDRWDTGHEHRGIVDAIAGSNPANGVLSLKILTLLPTSLLWMAHENFQGLSLSPCVREVQVPEGGVGWNSDNSLSITYNIKIDFLKRMGLSKDGKEQFQTVYRLELLNKENRLPAEHQIVGITHNDEAMQPWGRSGFWKSIIANPSAHFQPTQDPQILKNFADLENQYGEELRTRQENERERLENTIKVKSSVRADRLMGLALVLGTDTNLSPLAADLAQSLLTGDILPSPEVVSRALYSDGISRAELDTLIGRRIAIVEGKLNALAALSNLSPRTQDVQNLISRLQKLAH